MESQKSLTIKGLNLKNVAYDNKGYLANSQGTVKQNIVCIRPAHKKGIPKVYSEFKNGKFISHNYGHSGVGYSIMFGTIDQSIENMQKLKSDFSSNKSQEITVIGFGCIGLYTALKLFYLGYRNVKIVGENFQNNASQQAGGLFEFSLNTVVNKENIQYLNDIFKTSFEEYKKIIEKKHEFLNEGVKYVDYYTDFYEENVGLSYLSSLGLIPKMQKLTLEIDSNKSLKMELYHFKTVHIITSIFMDGMFRKLKENKISHEFKKIKNFGEISSEIIFNCTGLGSRELNQDSDCYPVCGHGFVLDNLAYGDYDYILRLGNVPGLKDKPIGGAVYFMPKTSGFIGGTYIKDYDGSDNEFNILQLTNLMERAKFLYNGVLDEKKFELTENYLKSKKPKF